ncbi:S-layer homology domain-containing protein [Paenibacillus chartarius]|uniref:S-layer homology domain-containing protein n=1 Tax=Paenibacillus chartarius TaxID=747481 RepID=A0ABV6DJU0_9BACL
MTKKVLCYLLTLALVFTLLPVNPVVAATANAPNYFIPDDGTIKATANLDLKTTPLTRDMVKIFNTSTMSIAGVYQQVTASSMKLTVDQIIYDSKTNSWVAVPGNSMTMPIVSSANNRFSVTGITLYPGFNRLSMSGNQGNSTNTDYFYVLYDTAPILNSMQAVSSNIAYDLNEGSGLVVTSNSVMLQGTTSNVKTITVNGTSFNTYGNGSFYSPGLTLQPGINDLDITLSSVSDSIKIQRRIYYYDTANPFTRVDLTNGQTKSLIGTTPPAFTGTNATPTVAVEFLLPYNSNTFAANGSITFNGAASLSAPTVTETVINSTYGTPAYRLVKVTGTYNMTADPTGPGSYAATQNLDVKVSYTPTTGTFTPVSHRYSYTQAWGQVLVNSVLLLPDATSKNTDPTAIDDNTVTAPLNGQSIENSSFYVLVTTSDPGDSLAVPPIPANGVPAGSALKVDVLSTGTSPSVSLTATQLPSVTISGAKYKGVVYKVSGMTEGNQTLGFSVDQASLPGPDYSATVNHVSKNYITIDNLTEGQVIYMDSSGGATLTIPFSGKIIGFGPRLMTNPQLLINGVDKTSLYMPTVTPNSDGLTHDIPSKDLPVDRTAGPLFFGQNEIKVIANYSDGASGVLRQYEKSIKFYIIDKNVPTFANVRPLTPPASSTTTRGPLSSSDPAAYLPASPEFQYQTTYYATTLDAVDLFFEGSGATHVEVSNGSPTLLYVADIASGLTSQTIGVTGVTADFYGSTSGFRFRLNNVPLNLGTTVFTIVITNSNGGKSTQTLEIQRTNEPYKLYSPVANTGDQIIVNKNFVLFDIEAKGASEVTINGNKAEPRTDFADRYVYTVTGLKGDADNKINVVVKRATGDIKDTVTVRYVTDPAVGSMYMEKMGTKHSVFDKSVQLTFEKGTLLRRVSDGKVQPQGNLLFGIADPTNGNTELVNDYGQKLGSVADSRTPNAGSIIQIGSLSNFFAAQFGRDHFTPVSSYYWISAGLGEYGSKGESGYRPATGGLPPYSKEGAYAQYNNNIPRKIAPSERGELTLKFNSDVVDMAGTNLTVFYLDDGTSTLGGIPSWKNLGGVVDVKNNTITVPFENFGFYFVGKLKYGYDDVTDHGWARDILQALYSKGYMPALYNNAFGANDSTTRGEFAGILVRSLGMKLYTDQNPNNRTFIDVLPGAHPITWSFEEIETAARAGIVQGQNNGVFAPNEPLTRQDAAVMIARALSLKQAVNDSKLKAKIEKAFADGAEINHYALPAVDALNSAGIMVGSTNGVEPTGKAKPAVYFNPLANMTRAEAGQIAVRLLQKYLKALPANLS